MPRNKLKRYTGAEVAQPKSIAEQLLAGTRIGNLLYGKQQTYKDGDNQERKDVSFNESANGQLVQRMGETAKDVGELSANALAFGNPLTASAYMAPLIAGSQAYWITHGINDGAQRIENIGEGVKNFVEDSSWQNAGTVINEVPMLALDVAGALPVAKTIVETGKNVIPVAQQAAQRIAGSVDDAITTATKQAVESGVVGVNELPAQLAARATSTPKVQEPLPNVGWAPAQTMNVRRAGELTEMYYPNRWDVVEEGANPFGVWLQGKFGTPRTNITNPGKGEKAAKARELFASRPQHNGVVTFKKPIQTIGEVPNRSLLSYEAEKMGADGIIYNGIYDNGYNNNQVIFSFNKPELGKGYSLYERPSKLTWEERLGIPKGERNQPGKPRSPRAVEYDVVDGRPTKEFLDDYHTYVEALKTGGRRVDITDMFDSSWYRQRLLNQGLTEEQANQLILRLKDRVSPENLVVVDGLNSVRNFRRVEDGIPIEMTPERLTEFGRHTTGPGLSGKSLISLTTKADPEEIILHEIGGHRSQPLVADFNDTYLDQSLTNLGLQRHMKIGKTADYGLNWGEVRARALTIAKQMSDAGWNPNSPEQINVWLNKHIFTNSSKNANQGALYYDRPRFIKAVATGLKQGGKIENPGQ